MDFSWGKGGRCVWLTTYNPCSAETSRKSGAFNYPEPLGPPIEYEIGRNGVVLKNGVKFIDQLVIC